MQGLSSSDAATKREGRGVKKSEGREAAAARAARRTERRAGWARAKRNYWPDTLQDEIDRLDEPERLLEELDRVCTLLLTASLDAAGFKPPNHGPERRGGDAVEPSSDTFDAYTELALDENSRFMLQRLCAAGEAS